MGWESAVALNAIIAVCYVLIAGLIVQGLVRTQQLTTNALAVATAAIFTTCAVHHGHHAAHVAFAVGPDGVSHLVGVRAVFGEWHTVLVDLVGATVAVTYLRLRHTYGALLRTPAMFDDAVRVAAERQLRELAYTDLLTGAPNRAAYQERADALAADGRETTVLFLDLDGFKQVNDRLGHDTGDRLLRDVAQRLMAELQEHDVYRLGGDEFVVVAVGCPRPAAPALVERASRALAAPLPVRDGTVQVGASIGAATGPARTVDELLRAADMQMYARKGARQVPRPRPQPRPAPTTA